MADIFRDHSLTATTLKSQRLASTIARLKSKQLQLQESQLGTERKVSMINEYSEIHGVKVNAKERIKMVR